MIILTSNPNLLGFYRLSSDLIFALKLLELPDRLLDILNDRGGGDGSSRDGLYVFAILEGLITLVAEKLFQPAPAADLKAIGGVVVDDLHLANLHFLAEDQQVIEKFEAA